MPEEKNAGAAPVHRIFTYVTQTVVTVGVVLTAIQIGLAYRTYDHQMRQADFEQVRRLNSLYYDPEASFTVLEMVIDGLARAQTSPYNEALFHIMRDSGGEAVIPRRLENEFIAAVRNALPDLEKEAIFKDGRSATPLASGVFRAQVFRYLDEHELFLAAAENEGSGSPLVQDSLKLIDARKAIFAKLLGMTESREKLHGRLRARLGLARPASRGKSGENDVPAQDARPPSPWENWHAAAKYALAMLAAAGLGWRAARRRHTGGALPKT